MNNIGAGTVVKASPWGVVAHTHGRVSGSNIPEKQKECLFNKFQTKVLTNTFICDILTSTNKTGGYEMANNITFGYARVSSDEQNEARQLEQLRSAGIDERYIFVDKESGKDFNREKYCAMVTMLREGDVIYVTSLDRLGRNYKEIGEQWGIITMEKKADVVVMDMPILDTRNKNDLTGTLITDIVLKLLSYVAEKERENIKKRQAEGIAIAKAMGKYQGRKPIQVDKVAFEKIYAEVVRGERTNRYAMQKLGLKPNTYYKAVNEYKTKTGQWG